MIRCETSTCVPPEPLSEGDGELLARVANRDRDALRSLYLRYHPRLTRFLRRFTTRTDDAEEIVNDTLYVVWCKAPEFRGDSKPSTWIMGIAYRRALKTLQRTARTPISLGSPQGLEDIEDSSAENSRIEREWLDAGLAELPLEQRMALELTYYMGHSCEEIAAIMQCPANTVKTRMFNARAKLRARMPALAGVPADARRGEGR